VVKHITFPQAKRVFLTLVRIALHSV
jgi:hypothetical protein